MSVTAFERGNSWKTTVQFLSGQTGIDPSGNFAFLTVRDPNGDILTGYDGVSGNKVSAGLYKYYVYVPDTSDLGFYHCLWSSSFNYSSPWNFMTKTENEIVLVKKIIQS